MLIKTKGLFKVILVAIITLMTSGCSDNFANSIQNTNSKTKDVQGIKGNLVNDFQNINIKYKSLLEKFMIRNYYSPDYKVYIKEEINGIQDEVNSYLHNIYLGTSEKPLDNMYQEALEQNISTTPAIWICNDRVIIKGEYIYNVYTNKVEKRIMRGVIKDGILLSYAINHDSTLIAYSIVNDGEIGIYIYNLNNDVVNKIYSQDTAITSKTFLNILWDSDNNIYFNVTDNAETFKILKYDFLKKTTGEYTYNGILINNSYDKKYLVIGNIEEEKTVILDLTNENSFTIPYSIELVWLPNQHIFVYVPIEGKAIYICYIDNKITQDKLLNIQDIKGKDEIIQNLRCEKDEILVDLVKYEYPEFRYLIEYSKTYQIEFPI